MSRIAFIGGGGFAKEAREIALLRGHEVVGYTGKTQGILHAPYWGTNDALLDHAGDFDSVFVAFGAVNRASLEARRDMISWVDAHGLAMEPLVSPHATISAGVSIAAGALVAHGVVVSVDARIDRCAILNTSAIVGHDVMIGAGAILAPGAFVGGTAAIGDHSLIGPGVIVLEGRRVGSFVVAGLGSTVVRSITDGATVMPQRSRVLNG